MQGEQVNGMTRYDPLLGTAWNCTACCSWATTWLDAGRGCRPLAMPGSLHGDDRDWVNCVGIPGHSRDVRVTRRCRRGVARKSRLAVGFLVSRMGGASVICGNVMMGEASITLCSSSRAACCSANLTLCSSKIGGGSRIESMRVPRSLRSQRPFGVTPAMAAFSVNSSVSARKC